MTGIERIEACFGVLRDRGHKALIAYLCMGDPSFDDAIENAIAAVEAGADVLELGVPFSDPVADGPVLERAALRAIAAGGSLARTIEAAKKIRARTTVPLVLFTYFNPLFVAGPSMVARAAEAGIDALLVVDLPADEGADFREQARAHGVAMIPLLTPTSTDTRIAAAGREASGFLYYVSLTGITGAAAAPLEEASIAAEKMRAITGLPVVVGFGIDGPTKARAAAGTPDGGASGVVIGTALVHAIDVAYRGGVDASRESSGTSGSSRATGSTEAGRTSETSETSGTSGTSGTGAHVAAAHGAEAHGAAPDHRAEAQRAAVRTLIGQLRAVL